jgi:hypothetical protein
MTHEEPVHVEALYGEYSEMNEGRTRTGSLNTLQRPTSVNAG